MKQDRQKDPRRMRPSALLRLVNSTPLGEVLKHRQLYEHQNAAGMRIGDGKHIDLVRYAAWLFCRTERLGGDMPRRKKTEQPLPAAPPGSDAYEARKAAAGRRNLQMSSEGRDIGKCPQVVNPKRRERACKDFRFFCETYFSQRFFLAWSDDHLKVIERIQQAVLGGGLFAVAMPRGSGKTALAEVGVMWGALPGRHKMVAGLGATKLRGRELLESIAVECECNDLLLDDFPEVCYPIRCLEGIANRCAGQTSGGVRTRITWTKDVLVLPTVEGSPASGVIIKVGGLTGGDVRGMHHPRPDGFMARPSLVLIDDPQTDKTARSPTQNHTREALLSGAVLGMAGPGEKISAVMPCTVIQPGDMADSVLDSDRHPDWNGIRTKMVYEFPKNEKLWEQYARLRADGLRRGDKGREATEFYRKNRRAMDLGAVVAWPERYSTDELSALQHAMNLRLRDEAAFFAEYQNEPQTQHADSDLLTAEQIRQRVSGLSRGAIPTACQHVTAFVDVHERLLYWMVCAWKDDFGGHIIDYGTWPDQQKGYFTYRQAARTLGRVYQKAGREGAILAGLEAITGKLMTRAFKRDDGAMLPLEAMMFDSGWEPECVYGHVRSSPARNIFPAKGLALTASSLPWDERKPKPGERNGDHWRIAPLVGRGKGRLVLTDVNHWKTFVHRRMSISPGDAGSLTVFGDKLTDGRCRNPEEHRLLSDHLTAEFRITTAGRGRVLDEWHQAPSRPDNHWLDCLVGCAVLASMLGCRAIGQEFPAASKKASAKPKRRWQRAA